MKFDKSSDAENDVMSISEENEVNKVDENNDGKENSWEVVYDKLPEEEPTTDKRIRKEISNLHKLEGVLCKFFYWRNFVTLVSPRGRKLKYTTTVMCKTVNNICKYYSIQEKTFFEGITTHKACIKIKLPRRECVSFSFLIIFDDFDMILKPDDRWLFTSFSCWGCFQQVFYISTT